MNKKTFLNTLKKHLKKLTSSEIKKHINYYDELLSDMMENGLSEAEAVAKIGTPKQIAQELLENAAPEDFKKKDMVGTILIAISIFLVAFILLSESFFNLLPISFSTSGSATSIAIIGGADGPTSIFLAGKVGTPVQLYILTGAVIAITVIYKVVKHFKK